jgi:hypothetical protein
MRTIEVTVGLVVAVPDDAILPLVDVELPLDLLHVDVPCLGGRHRGVPLSYYAVDTVDLDEEARYVDRSTPETPDEEGEIVLDSAEGPGAGGLGGDCD